MKYILAIALLISSQAVAKESFEVVYGGLTYHICCDANTSEKFSNKLADEGRLIYTSLAGIKYISSEDFFYTSIAGFAGQNSIGYNMQGALVGLGADLDNVMFGMVAGGYIQDRSEFERRGILLGTGGDFMPITGVEVNLKLYRNDDFYIRENNLFTFFIINHTISLGWDIK